MILLARILASIVRRVLTGAAISVLAVLVARGFFSVELRDEVMSWLQGGATEWIVTILMALIGAGLTWLDKYRTKLREQAARTLPAGATEEDVSRKMKMDSLGKSIIERIIAGGRQ